MATDSWTAGRTMGWIWWRRWMVFVTLGELAGFVAPALAGALLSAAAVNAATTLLVMLSAGAVEGTILGWAQASALRKDLPGLPRYRFAAATGLAAVVAYAVGMLPSTLGGRLAGVHPLILGAAAAAGAVVLLGSIGTGQWLVLRRVVPRAGWWIAATAGAWAAGLSVFLLVATPLWQQGQPLWLTVVIGILAGALMAATVAALTGLAAARLLRQAEHSSMPVITDSRPV
ncbi:MAG TPA: hypothetical protein VFC19_45460 [Candidatus Limnocylindrales bacterium]|nr:hypothetical protein [Candidatus Limnocylindrales bacterium]